MPTVNNIVNVKILSVFNNGSVNFGNTLHKGHTANSKSVSDSTNIGDASLNSQRAFSRVNDPDFLDQPASQV